jgi:hypothetical protein
MLLEQPLGLSGLPGSQLEATPQKRLYYIRSWLLRCEFRNHWTITTRGVVKVLLRSQHVQRDVNRNVTQTARRSIAIFEFFD